jgi:hypothetical protein
MDSLVFSETQYRPENNGYLIKNLIHSLFKDEEKNKLIQELGLNKVNSIK